MSTVNDPAIIVLGADIDTMERVEELSTGSFQWVNITDTVDENDGWSEQHFRRLVRLSHLSDGLLLMYSDTMDTIEETVALYITSLYKKPAVACVPDGETLPNCWHAMVDEIKSEPHLAVSSLDTQIQGDV